MVCFDSINWADIDEISIRSDEFEENGFPEIAWAMRWIVKNGKKPGPLPHPNGIDYTWWRCNGDTWDEIPHKYYDAMCFGGPFHHFESLTHAYLKLIVAICKVEFNNSTPFLRCLSLQK